MGTGIETGSAPDTSNFSFPEFFSGGTAGTQTGGNTQTPTAPVQTPNYQPNQYPQPQQPQYVPPNGYPQQYPSAQPNQYPNNNQPSGYPQHYQPVTPQRQPQGYPSNNPQHQPNTGYPNPYPNNQPQQELDPIEVAKQAGEAGYRQALLNDRAVKLGYSSIDALINTIDERYEWDQRNGNQQGIEVYKALTQLYKTNDFDRAEALIQQYYGHGFGYRPNNPQSQNFVGLNPGQSLNFQQNQSSKPYADEKSYDRARWYGTPKEQEAAIAAMDAFSKKGELPY